MNNINIELTKYIEYLDIEIIKLLSIRQNYKTNTIIYKSDYTIQHISLIEKNIYDYEKNNINMFSKSYQKLFNPLLIKKKQNHILDLEDLNLNKIIKQSYLSTLYDLCEYGNDEEKYLQQIIDLDIKILYKLSERIHFGYEIIKHKYIKNKNFFEQFILNNNNSFSISLYLNDTIDNISYLDKIQSLSNLYKINYVITCSFYKLYIIPFYLEIQLHFLYKLINI